MNENHIFVDINVLIGFNIKDYNSFVDIEVLKPAKIRKILC